jgi:hypothetical protein
VAPNWSQLTQTVLHVGPRWVELAPIWPLYKDTGTEKHKTYPTIKELKHLSTLEAHKYTLNNLIPTLKQFKGMIDDIYTNIYK